MATPRATMSTGAAEETQDGTQDETQDETQDGMRVPGDASRAARRVSASVGVPAAYGGPSERDVMVRAAWHYYVEGQTQEAIARRLGLTRVKVNRLIQSARADGTVSISVRSATADALALGLALRERFGLREAHVAPSPADPAETARVVGLAAGEPIAALCEGAGTVAVGWGRTLSHAFAHLAPPSPRRGANDAAGPADRARVVSLLGGPTRSVPRAPGECAAALAAALDAECALLPLPAYADTSELRGAMMAQRAIAEVLAVARTADAAILSVGELGPDCAIRGYGFVTEAEFLDLARSGAVGDVLCQFVDREGRPVDHPLNARVCALPLDALAAIPSKLLVSGGIAKVPAMRAALDSLRFDALVTDEAAARGLLAPGGPQGSAQAE